MTDLERKVVAVAFCRPTHHLTIASQLGRGDFMRSFAALKKRIARRRAPLIYVGVATEGLGDGGYHVHLLLWEYLHLKSLRFDLRALGLGQADMRLVRTEPDHLFNAFETTAYVLAQEQPVFGTTKHHEKHPRSPSKRRFLTPHRSTLHARHPQLLAALDAANDPDRSDEMLLSALPRPDRTIPD